jgi:uncharacterized protein
MDSIDIALIDQLTPVNSELGRLWQEHKSLEERLDALGKHCYLTREEEIEQRTLKKKKLVGRDRIEKILAPHR